MVEIQKVDLRNKVEIGKLNNEPIYSLGIIGKVMWKNHWINLYYPDKLQVIKMIDHYFGRGLLNHGERMLFEFSIDKENKNPFADLNLVKNMIEKAQEKSYELSHNVIPEFIAYPTFSKSYKEDISLQDLKDFHNHFVDIIKNDEDKFIRIYNG